MKKKVFITGATGHMGGETLARLLTREDLFDVVALVRPSAKNRKALEKYKDAPLKLLWGDLTRYQDVLKGVTGADYVLHIGGMVSPAADRQPDLAYKVNVTSARHLVDAIKAQPDPDKVKLVYIGSVAQTGDRNPPLHWGRCGDPINPAAMDAYALSKAEAERIVAGSGLRHWVSLRQTGILHPGLMSTLDPIIFHYPLNGALEWITARESGVMLEHLCEYDLPEDFWRRFYNVGGSKSYRSVYWQFMQLCFGAMGVKDFRRMMDCRWFALHNFHGQWFTDSDLLENTLHFRAGGSLEDYAREIRSQAPFYYRLAGVAPGALLKRFLFKPLASQKPLGPLYWKEADAGRLQAAFGSAEQMDTIPSWKDFKLERPSRNRTYLDHGYDESESPDHMDIGDMRRAALFRGGECLSTSMEKGDMYTPLEWKCAFAHRFSASPALVLLGGHWCPECTKAMHTDLALRRQVANRSAFYSQVFR